MLIRSGWEIKTEYRDIIDSILETKILPRQIDVVILGIAIGITNDKYAEPVGDENLSIPYNTLNKSDIIQTVDYLYQTAILTSSESKKLFDENERLQLAFDDDHEEEGFNKNRFLIGFSTYGIKYICQNLYNKEDNVFYDNLKMYIVNELNKINSKNIALTDLG